MIQGLILYLGNIIDLEDSKECVLICTTWKFTYVACVVL